MAFVRNTTGAAVIVAAALLLTGCTAPDGQEQPTASASVDADRLSPEDLPEAPAVTDGQGAVADTSFGDCAVAEGEQTVTGTVTNSTAEPTDYVITVSWINDSSDVRARGIAVVEDVEPAATQDFTLSAQVPAGVATCTFHVVRGGVE